ncbi:hypothetical protein ACFY1P_08115 [Streptomyces sp. NPDC001407]|uniref:hypothetical protein n=1 Tax=Streptomyces sp. NPDC001407 TaxID=3364573 RepID=UPI0036B1283E
MANASYVWDGKKWNPHPVTVRDGNQWRQAESIPMWDGVEWRTTAPEPWEFSQYIDSNVSEHDNPPETVTGAIPSGLRLADLVLSVCVSYKAEKPPAAVPLDDCVNYMCQQLVPTEIRMDAILFPWSPARGNSVTWGTNGAEHVSILNMVYRNTEFSKWQQGPKPETKSANSVSSLPLKTSGEYLNVFVAVAASPTIGNFRWPSGVKERISQYGQHGSMGIRLSAADIQGTKPDPGDVLVNGVAEAMSVVRFTLPGRKGHGPLTWILDNENASILGQTATLS